MASSPSDQHFSCRPLFREDRQDGPVCILLASAIQLHRMASRRQELSCCSKFIARPRHLQHKPHEFSQQLLDLLFARTDLPSLWTSRWFEHNWYFLFGAANFSNLQLYRDIDSHAENSIPFLELTHNLNGQTLVLKPGASKRKIYDVFLFHNELDMLELRLIEQEHVVDCFVIIEQPHTLAGTPKPLYFKEQNTTWFARFMNKFITLTSEDKPHPDAWARAQHIRNTGLTAPRL